MKDRGLRTVLANAGILAGALLGIALGLFGLLVGLILGFMVDTIRAEFGLRAYLAEADAPVPDEAFPGLIAALALASLDHEGQEGAPGFHGAEGRSILGGLLDRALAPGDPGKGIPALPGRAAALVRRLVHRPWPGSVLALLEEGPPLDAALLARRLALEGGEAARYLLAEASWSLEARRGGLSWQREREIALLLAEAGLGADKILLARARFFPEWESPWEVLGLEAGAPQAALRKAYRELSKRWHPDSSGSPGGSERFRRAKEAYETLSRLNQG